jgi:hypothetical protein
MNYVVANVPFRKRLFILTFFAAFLSQIQAQSFLTNGLVAYFPFDGNANDASGNGYHLVSQGATPATDRFGVASNCFYFDGNAYMASTNNFSITGNSPRTVSAWCYSTNSQQQYIAHWGVDNSGAGYDSGFYIYPSSLQLYLHGYYSDVASFPTNGAGAWSLYGKWFHVVYTYSNSISNACIYLNGQILPASILSQNVSSWNTVSNTLLQIGSDTSAASPRGWRGALDDVRIYNRALSSFEVSELYTIEGSHSPPQIYTDITNVGALFGSDAAFVFSAVGSPPIFYQWYSQNTNLQVTAGAYAETISSFVYAVVVTNGGAGYSSAPNVHFEGGGGTGAAAYATTTNGAVSAITVTNAGFGYTNPPTVLIDPPDGLMTGQTNSVLILRNVDQHSVGNYWVVASNSFGSVTSSIASLILLYPPGIATQPSDLNISLHGSGTLSVTPSGTPPFQYQWTFVTNNLPGATNSSLTLTNFNTNQVGSYFVTVYSPYGQATSSIAQVQMLPSLTLPFTGAVGLWGQPTTLSVGAIGTGTLQYQWYFNGVPISGATSNSLTFASVQFTNAGLYSVVVSSALGSVTNSPYQLVVNPANVSLGLYPGVMISGTLGYSYEIQGTIDLSNTNSWVTLTNITLTQPSQIWSDYSADAVQPGNPRKFYRVLGGSGNP